MYLLFVVLFSCKPFVAAWVSTTLSCIVSKYYFTFSSGEKLILSHLNFITREVIAQLSQTELKWAWFRYFSVHITLAVLIVWMWCQGFDLSITTLYKKWLCFSVYVMVCCLFLNVFLLRSSLITQRSYGTMKEWRHALRGPMSTSSSTAHNSEFKL